MFDSLYKMTAADGQQKNDIPCQFGTGYTIGADGGLHVVSNCAGVRRRMRGKQVAA